MNASKRSIARRSFMKTASAAFAAPFIIPSTALGQNGDTAPSKKLTFGLIGCGGQGRHVMGGILSFKDAHVLAVADVNKKNLNEAARMVNETYGNADCTLYHDYRELIARDDIDAVIIGTPDHWHALTCVAAAKGGKHIYCEKPITHKLREGRAVADAVKANNITFQTGSMQRAYGDMKKACQVVRNGYIGKIRHIEVGLPDGGHAQWVTSYPEPPETLDWDFYVGPTEWTPFHPDRYDWNWRWWTKFGGGQMMDWIGHHGDIAHMGMGWDNTGPSKVEPVLWEYTKEKNNLYNAAARYQFNCTYADGTTMTVGNTSDLSDLFKSCKDTGTLWYGEDDQWVFVSRGGMKASSPEIENIDFKDSDFTFRRQGNHIRDWYECIKSGEETACPAETGHRSASIGHLGMLASELGATIKWDPETERILEEDSLNHLFDLHYRGDWKLEA